MDEILSPEELLSTFCVRLPAPDPSYPPEVQQIIAYLHRHLFDPNLTAATVMKALRMRDHNTSSVFAACIGCGIRAYVNCLRVKAAQLLLRRTGTSVTEVALAVGYTNVSTFTQAFRRETDLTPTAYRRAQKKSQKK